MRKAKITIAVIAVLVISAFSILAINSGATAKNLELKTIKLESTEKQLKNVNNEFEQLKIESSQDKAKREQLEKEKQELEAKLQAKAEAKKQLEIAAEQAKQAIASKPTAVAAAAPAPAPQRAVTGTKTEWMAAAGIPEAHWSYVDSIVTRESGWNPNAVNKSSGACGLGQQLPCGKWAGAWNDPVAALVAMTGYVNGRYGGWPQAVAFWNANHWY